MGFKRAWMGCLMSVALLGQTAPEALDVVPPGAMLYLFAKSPLLVQAKVQGLIQRMQGKGPDPLSEAQERFGLRRLPVDRRGLVLVYQEGLDKGDAHPLVFLAVKDPKPLLEELKAAPGESGVYHFKGQGAARALVLREGWAILGDQGQIPALRKAAKAKGGLRPGLGDLSAWLEARDFSGLMTAEGLWSIMQEFRKQAGASRAKAPTGTVDQFAKVEQFLAQAEREVRHLGFGADVDEHGSLKAVLRLQLQPQGQWAQTTAGLEETPDFGLAGLRGKAFVMAMGGVLPSMWMREAAMIGLSAQGMGPELGEPERLDRQAALDRIYRQIRGVHMVMDAGPQGPQQRLEVEDAEGYMREQEAFWAMESVRPGGMRLETRRTRVGDHEALLLVMGLSDEAKRRQQQLPPQAAETYRAAMQRPISTLLKWDPHTVSVISGPAGSEGPDGVEETLLKDSEGVKAVSSFLPDRAHFFMFMDMHRILGAQAEALQTMEGRLTEVQRRDLPPLPARPAFPPLALALRYEPGAWELHLALPWETQVGLARQAEDQKATAARTAAVQKVLADQNAQPATGGDEPDED